jgi:DNA repair exonuclease SbcCD ATPase subunit
MAVICHGCGGVVGRDCFNPQECEQITRSLANQALSDTQRYGGSPEEIFNLLNEKDDKIEELEIKADSLTRDLSELRDKVEFYRNDTAKLRDFVFDSKTIGHPTQSIFDAVMDKFKSLHEEIENLQSVMVAAAEEIKEHWPAHCDEEGYGPANLMHRLEKGIAANYPGYKPGAFKYLQEENERLKKTLQTKP